MEFIERYRDRPFTKWKGGRYRIYMLKDEVEFYVWIFENKLEKEIKFENDHEKSWREQHDDKNPVFMNFRTGETFMAFKLTWL